MNGAWSQPELEEFLTSQKIPLRLACRTQRNHLWLLSLWYQYRKPKIMCATGKDADVVSYLDENPAVAFEISTNHPPYMGVRGRGHATIEPDSDKELLTELLEQYLDGTNSELAQRLLSPDRQEVTITITPELFYTWDFSDRMPTN